MNWSSGSVPWAQWGCGLPVHHSSVSVCVEWLPVHVRRHGTATAEHRLCASPSHSTPSHAQNISKTHDSPFQWPFCRQTRASKLQWRLSSCICYWRWNNCEYQIVDNISIDNFVFSFLHMLTTWHWLHLPTTDAERWLCRNQSIDICCPEGPQQQTYITYSSRFPAVGSGWQRQTDTALLHRPCSTY